MANPKLAMIPTGYKAGKLYSVLPESGVGDFTFDRNSLATRVNENGLIETMAIDVPRLDYTDGGCPSLLLEPERTNLVPYSEDFSQWSKQSGGTGSLPIITSNDTISPDGTQNSDKVVFDKGTSSTVSDLSILTTSFTSQSNTASIYIKADSPQRIVIRNSSTWVGYDIGTEWTRIEKTDTGGSFQIGLRDGYGVADVPSTATVYLWGAQLEEGSYATSYIPTNGTAVTRVGETCTDAGDASTFNDSEGVLMAEISALANDGTNRMISLTNGVSTDSSATLYFTPDANQIRYIYEVSGSQQCSIVVNINVLLNNKFSIVYKLNRFELWGNGFKLGEDTNGTLNPQGTFTKLSFLRGASQLPFYGNTKQLQYFDSALTDEELETLTSWQSFSEMANGQNYTII